MPESTTSNTTDGGEQPPRKPRLSLRKQAEKADAATKEAPSIAPASEPELPPVEPPLFPDESDPFLVAEVPTAAMPSPTTPEPVVPFPIPPPLPGEADVPLSTLVPPPPDAPPIPMPDTIPAPSTTPQEGKMKLRLGQKKIEPTEVLSVGPSAPKKETFNEETTRRSTVDGEVLPEIGQDILRETVPLTRADEESTAAPPPLPGLESLVAAPPPVPPIPSPDDLSRDTAPPFPEPPDPVVSSESKATPLPFNLPTEAPGLAPPVPDLVADFDTTVGDPDSTPEGRAATPAATQTKTRAKPPKRRKKQRIPGFLMTVFFCGMVGSGVYWWQERRLSPATDVGPQPVVRALPTTETPPLTAPAPPPDRPTVAEAGAVSTVVNETQGEPSRPAAGETEASSASTDLPAPTPELSAYIAEDLRIQLLVAEGDTVIVAVDDVAYRPGETFDLARGLSFVGLSAQEGRAVIADGRGAQYEAPFFGSRR